MKEKIMTDIKSKLDNIEDERKKKIITSIINNENWYKEISFDTFISILLDLNYSKEEAKDMYTNLLTQEDN